MNKSITYILLGSNQGNRELLLEQACHKINDECGSIVAKSSLYESAPWGFEADTQFINQVIEIETSLEAETLLIHLLEIETLLGRKRDPEKIGYASRPIDIDILYYGDTIINQPQLIIPHPRLHLRRFTLIPLCEIAPSFVHPIFQQTQTQLLDYCEDTLPIKKMNTNHI